MTGSRFTSTIAIFLASAAAAGCAGTGDAVVMEDTYTRDQVLAAAARQEALETLPSDASLEWRAPDGSLHGRIVPLRTFRSEDGSYCREFSEEVVSDDGVDRFTDVRCRTDEGRWLRPSS